MLPHPASLPPIWQVRARHGEDAAVLGRNPDGTFQVRLNGAEKTFKESQVAAMTGMQRGPLYEMLGRATVNREKKAGQAPLPPQAFAGVPSRRFQFSQTHPADSEAVSVHRQIAESEDSFQLGKSKPDSTSVQELVEAFSLQEQPLKLLEEKPYRGAGREYLLTTPKGIVRMVELTREKEIFVDTSKAASNESKAGGGAQIYQLAQTYAHNKGFRFRADDSVSEIAQKRRISQMIASALRHGTTQHLKGDHEFVDENGQWQVDVPGWKTGDHDHNLALLLKAEHAYVMQEAQARGIDLSHLTHDLATDSILDGHTGTPITRATLESLVDRLEPGASGVGAATLLRALVTGSALQREGSGGSVRPVRRIQGGDTRGEQDRQSNERLVSVARNLYYSRSPEGAGGLPPRRVGDAVSGGPGGLATTLAETARFLNQKQPGLVNAHTHLFTTVEELLASNYARQYPFTAEQIASLRTAEGFHDTETGHSFVIAENTRLLPGESPQQALTRVLLHERVGHGGLHILLGDAESARSRRWAALSAQIPPAELEAIAAETGYRHLAGKREDLAFEWFARRTEKDLNLLEKDSLPRQMWDAFREMVLDFMASLDLKPTLSRSFETQVKDLQRRAREAALRPVRDRTNAGQSAPDSFHPQATPDRRSTSSLDDVNHLFTSLSNNPHDGSLASHPPSLPPIWQGRARHGEDAAVLGRNPDGTFQVRLNGAEKTFKESQVAAMTEMQRGPLYAHLAQATRQQLALPHPSSLPPIWQGRARHGEDAAVLGRNPDGTFQARIGGQERTRTERDVAYMTGMQRGPLHEMLGRATVNKARVALLPPQAIAGVPRSRLHFSQTNSADSEVVSVHHRIAESEDAFQLGKSKPETLGNARENDWRDSLEELAVAFSVSESPLILGEDYQHHPDGYAFYLHTNKGSAFVIINPPKGQDKGTVQINSPGLDSNTEKAGGGAQVYQMVQTFAHNHGYTFLPEDTVSPIAQKRRISQMVSSALRHGTTQHLNGLATYKDAATRAIKTEVPGWKPGDHDHNLALLLRAEHAYVMQEAQARGIDLSHLTHDLATDSILDGHTGTPITRATLESLVDRLEPGVSGVGSATLLRALVTGSALQRSSAGSGVSTIYPDQGGHTGGTEGGGLDGELVSVARDLYYSRPSESAGGLPQRRVGDAVSRGPGGLATALAETARFLNQKQPGLVNAHTHLFTTVEELLASNYARQYPFTAEQIASLRKAEGFHDTETGHSFVIAENTRLLPGESPQQALIRVLLHERVGHGGLQILLGDAESARSRRWAALSAQIPPTELEAIAAETGYRHLAGRREDLAFEWFARRTEKEVSLLEKGSLPRQMWDAFREMVLDFMASLNLKSTLGRSFETQVKDLQRRAREAALRPVRDRTNAGQSAPDSFRPQATPDRRSTSSLDDVNHLFTSLSNNPHNGSLASHPPSLPPIWQGRARHGEDAAVLGRNPDGTFQVRLNGTEKTFKESQVAAMTGMQRGPLYEMLGRATVGRMRQMRRSRTDVPVTVGSQTQTDSERLKEPLEARWARKPLPAGTDPKVAEQWRQKLQNKHVPNPMAASDVFDWVEGLSFQDLRFETERAAQSLFDLLPREIMEKVGKVNVQLVKEIPGKVLGNYDANTNMLSISLDEYKVWSGRLRAGKMRELMWHELGHWLYHQADAHPRLKDWKQAIRLHWLKRVQGQPIRTHEEGWRYILDGWINEYAGRLYRGWAGGAEIPSVYLEEVSWGPERIAYHCRNKHQTETFDIVTSLFGPL